MTIPAVLNHYEEQEKISKIKKNISVFSQCFTLAIMDGSDGILGSNTSTYDDLKNWFDEFLKPYLALNKICYEEEGCWNETGTYWYSGSLASSSGKGIGTGIMTGILNDGTYINIDFWLQEHIWSYFGVETERYQAVTIYFDINGSRKPNKFGEDIFTVLFTENGLVLPFSDDTDRIESNCSKTAGEYSGFSCIWKYI